MRFYVNYRIFDKFPHLCMGVVIANGMDNLGTANELWFLISPQLKRES
jgi:hypothetical protein